MRRVLLLCGTLLWSSGVFADYLFLNLGIGENNNTTRASIPWDDGGGVGCTITAGYVYPVDKQIFIGARWLHISQCDKGKPFNDTPESSVDHFGVFLEYRIDL